MKVLILTTQPSLIEDYDKGIYASRTNWGMIELRKRYSTKILTIKRNMWKNTWILIKENFDVLYMHNLDALRFIPIQWLRLFFPSLSKKKIICLSHASIAGKGRRPNERGGG